MRKWLGAVIYCVVSAQFILVCQAVNQELNSEVEYLRAQYNEVNSIKESINTQLVKTGEIEDILYSSLEEQSSILENQDSIIILSEVTQELDKDTYTVDTQQMQKYVSVGDQQIQQNKAEYQRQVRKQQIASEMSRRGNCGRFTCPSVGIDVAIFAQSSQAVTDAADSANYFQLGGSMIVADHVNQGFNRIKSMGVGTLCYIETGSQTKTYRVTGKINGHNTGYDLTDSNYNSILGSAPLILYTCNENWQNITIVFCTPA